jgi:hypothetical protein
VLNPDDSISVCAREGCVDLKDWGKTNSVGQIAKGAAEVAVVAAIATVGAAALADTSIAAAPATRIIAEVARRLATEAALRAANAALANMPRFGRCVQNAVAAYRATNLPGAPLWFKASYIVTGCLT